MDVEVVDQRAGLLQEQARRIDDVGRPVRCAGGDELDGRVHQLHGFGELGIGAGVFGGGLVADLPGAVDLVADAPVAHVVRLREAMRLAQLHRLRGLRPVAVFQPVARLTQVAVAAVDHEEGLRFQQAAEADELVSAEVVALQRMPGEVEARRTFVAGADAVAPAVAGDEVAAGIADDGHALAPQRVEHVEAQALVIGLRRAGVVNAAVDAAVHVLGEAAEDVAVDGPGCAQGVEPDVVHPFNPEKAALSMMKRCSTTKMMRIGSRAIMAPAISTDQSCT